MGDAQLEKLLSIERKSLELLQPAGPAWVLELFPPSRYLPLNVVGELDHIRAGFHEVVSGQNGDIAVSKN